MSHKEDTVELQKARSTEYQRFLSQFRMHAVLKGLLAFSLNCNPNSIKLNINAKGESYTDGKSITVSLMHYFYAKKYGPETWGVIMKMLAYHESQHVNSSKISAMRETREWYGEYLNANHGINKSIGSYIGGNFLNIVEDGRIELINVKRMPGNLFGFRLLNSVIREHCAIKGVASTGTEEFQDFTGNFLSYCKTGLYAPGVKAYRKARFEKEFLAIKALVDKGIEADMADDCVDVVKQILVSLAPYFADLMRKDSQLRDFLEKLAQAMFDEWSEDNETQTNSNSGDGPTITVRVKRKAKPGEKNPEMDKKNSAKKKGADKDAKSEADKSGQDAQDDAAESGAGGSDEAKDDSAEVDGGGAGQGNDESSKSETDDAAESGAGGSDEAESEQDSEGSSGDSQPPDGDSSLGSDSFDDDAETVEGCGEEELEQLKRLFQEDVQNAAAIERSQERNAPGLSNAEKQKIEGKYADERTREFTESFPRFPSVPLPAELLAEAKALRREFERVLKNKKVQRRGQKKGVLDTTGLWKVGVDSPYLFQKKGQPVIADCVVFQLIDNSGSMSSHVDYQNAISKAQSARTASAVIEEAIRGILPCKISLFSVNNSIEHKTIKEFRDNSKHNYSWSSLKAVGPSGGNKDGYSIRVATAELLKQAQRKRILLLLSDGLPSDYNGGSAAGKDDVKAAVKEARRKGITVIPVMFGDADFCQRYASDFISMYERDIIACSANNIMKEFKRLFGKFIQSA